MALTTEQVFALGILYNKLATTVYGEDGPKANNFAGFHLLSNLRRDRIQMSIQRF